MRKCNNQDCGTLWLDPMPVEADLPKLYAGYYTHQSPAIPASGSRLRALLDRVLDARLHARYGYEPSSRSWIDRLLGLATYLHPGWCDTLDAGVFHLHAQPGGRLLEIGCGSGAAMQLMKRKGWEVTGLDFDEGAVSNARSKGLDVRHGQLSAQAFADDCFDAVVMSHVIEHVPAPGELLAECRRILKKGGVLVVLTPNAVSRGHKHYGQNWRGLEPPRHLQIFTPRSLASVGYGAGFDTVETFTSMQGAVYIWYASGEIARNGGHNMNAKVGLRRRILLQITGLAIGWAHVLFPGRGEVTVMVCRK
jgi:2-polyprenyl-3-methyl-5-hydroxy-6-metoxy-1,4-benzoquinol methylase